MDLRTTYMGMTLKNPLVVSASPLSEKVDNIKRMEDAGASAVVMFSIFEEQLRQEAAALDHFLSYGTESFAEALSYFPSHADYRVGPERYLEILHRASEAVKIPIIGSLNGISNEGWTDYARKMQEAGAKGVELNIYHIPTDPRMTGAQVEQQYYDVFSAVKRTVSIPVAVKLSPFFSSMAHVAQSFDQLGADALVMFNRFIQPDFDLEEMEVTPNLGPSSPGEIRLPLRWIAILHGRLRCSLAASRGVHSATEIIKYILAGADVTMTTWSLLKLGIGHISTMLKDLEAWMEAKEYVSVAQMKGAMSQKSVADPTAFERANYIKTLEKYKGAPTP
jgi:dihydroorotate dehydrogenase (fumarate)